MASSIPLRPWKDPEDVLSPESDGKPLGETSYHVLATLTRYDTLRTHFRNVPDGYVACDMFLYYEQGNPPAPSKPRT
jgi:hypothetical protein